jgi:hypothetical protein
MRALKLVSNLIVATFLSVNILPSGATAAEETKVDAFLNVTGFDVSLDSIRLSAQSAPMMLGMDADDFGYQWTLIANDVFASEGLRETALDMLSQALSVCVG